MASSIRRTELSRATANGMNEFGKSTVSRSGSTGSSDGIARGRSPARSSALRLSFWSDMAFPLCCHPDHRYVRSGAIDWTPIIDTKGPNAGTKLDDWLLLGIAGGGQELRPPAEPPGLGRRMLTRRRRAS